MTLSDDERDQQVFMGLVAMLSENTMMALGKIVAPGATDVQIDLPAAESLINLVEVLKKRTQGNLADREARWLDAQLTTLRLNYLEVKKTAEKAKPAGG